MSKKENTNNKNSNRHWHAVEASTEHSEGGAGRDLSDKYVCTRRKALAIRQPWALSLQSWN